MGSFFVNDKGSPDVRPEADDEESSEDDFGPALPPHLANRLNSASNEPTPTVSNDDDDDDYIGPRLPVTGKEASVLASQVSDIERRAESMKARIEGKDKEEIKRESWMLELPDAKAKSFGLGPRTFLKKGKAELGDRSAWTDTPEEREKRARGEIEDQDGDTTQHLINKARDEAMGKVADDLKKKRGTDSLLEKHEKKLKKKKKKEKSEPQERRPFDRDQDLGVNKFDDARRKLMIKKSAEISSRFSSGAQKYL